jgi:hypothetical protein
VRRSDGPVELVFVGPMLFHVELFWAIPEFKAFFDQLATFCRVVMFDKAGNGLSDPIPKVRLLEERAAEIEAVMDAVGFAKPVLLGQSEGGIGRGGTGVDADPRPSDRDAPLGPRRGGDRQADTVGHARDGPARPGRRPQMSRDDGFQNGHAPASVLYFAVSGVQKSSAVPASKM